MRRIRIISNALWSWLAAMAMLIVSCNRELIEPDDTKQSPEAYSTVRVHMTVVHPDASASTKADEISYDNLGFSEEESAVNNLFFFIVDLDGEGNEKYPVPFEQICEIDNPEFTSGIFSFDRTFEFREGSKHIYVGANMNAEHLSAFRTLGPEAVLTAAGDGPAVSMVMATDPTHSGKGTDILMFSQATRTSGNGDDDFSIKVIKDADNRFALICTPKRLVSKVLVTAELGSGDYVKTGNAGWVHIDNVRYSLNTTNRQTYIHEKLYDLGDEKTFNIDPNWLATDFLSGGNIIDFEKHGESFDYISDINAQIRRMYDNEYSTTALPYNENRLASQEGQIPLNHYTEGLYCLENTVSGSGYAWTSEKDETARQISPYVMIAVRFIPRTVIKYDGTTPTENVISEQEMLDYYLVATGISQNDINEGIPRHDKGTYWLRKKNDGSLIYYGYRGMKKAMEREGLTDEDFICYEGGWSYFFTYADGLKKTVDDKSILTHEGQDVWGLQRNNYYILKIGKIGQPGANTPTDAMRINSISNPYIEVGNKEITIRPE